MEKKYKSNRPFVCFAKERQTMECDDPPDLEPATTTTIGDSELMTRFVTHGVAIPKTQEEWDFAITKFTDTLFTTQFCRNEISEQIALCFFTGITNPAIGSASYDERVEKMRQSLYPDPAQFGHKLSALQCEIVSRPYQYQSLDDRIAHANTIGKKGLSFLGACPATMYHHVHKSLVDSNPQYNFARDVFPMKLGNWMVIQTEGQTQNTNDVYTRCFYYHFNCLLKHREIFERRTEIGQFILMHRPINVVESQIRDKATPASTIPSLVQYRNQLLEREDRHVRELWDQNNLTPTMQMHRSFAESLQQSQQSAANPVQPKPVINERIEHLNNITSGDSGQQRFFQHCIATGRQDILEAHEHFVNDFDFLDDYGPRHKKSHQKQQQIVTESETIMFTPIHTAIDTIAATTHAVVMFLPDPLLSHQGGTHGIFNILFCGSYDRCQDIAAKCVDAFDNLIPAIILKSGKLHPMPIEVQSGSNHMLHKDRVAERKAIGT